MDLSNRTLALILVAAIVISIAGTMISLDRIGKVAVIGMATGNVTGTVDVTVSGQTSLVNRFPAIDFGSGYVDSSHNNCTMDTNESGSNTAKSCSGAWNTTANYADGHLLENQGNYNLTLQVNFSATGKAFIGGPAAGAVKPAAYVMFLSEFNAIPANTNVSGTPDTTDSCNAGWEDQGTWINISNTSTWYACGAAAQYDFDTVNTADEVEVNYKVVIPTDAGVAGKSVTATYLGVSAG